MQFSNYFGTRAFIALWVCLPLEDIILVLFKEFIYILFVEGFALDQVVADDVNSN